VKFFDIVSTQYQWQLVSNHKTYDYESSALPLHYHCVNDGCSVTFWYFLYIVPAVIGFEPSNLVLRVDCFYHCATAAITIVAVLLFGIFSI